MARENVDMIVVQSSGGDHEPVRVERRSGDRSRPVAQKACIGLEVRHWLSVVDVENLNPMLLSSTAIVLAARIQLLASFKLTLQRPARAHEH